MNSCVDIRLTGQARDRAIKSGLHVALASWQRAAFGLLVMGTVFNAAQCGAIRSRDAVIESQSAEIAQLHTECDLAISAEHEAVQAYNDLLLQVEQEKEATAAQAAAYESLGVYRYAGSFVVTAYCPCSDCCGRWADGVTATGLPAVPGIVAVDSNVIPLGSTVIIDGKRYLAADTGVTGNHVDIFLEEHAATVAFGVRQAEVWVVPCT